MHIIITLSCATTVTSYAYEINKNPPLHAKQYRGAAAAFVVVSCKYARTLAKYPIIRDRFDE